MTPARRSLSTLLLLVAAAGCGGSTADPVGDAGTPDAADDARDAPGDEPAGDAAGCALTFEHATLAVVQRDGTREDCASATWDGGTDVVEEASGQVTAVAANSFTLDTCPPNADCALSAMTFVADAPGIALASAIPSGAYVHVRWKLTRFWACQASLEVTSLPSWGGLANPVASLPALLLAVADGAAHLPGAPFTVDREKLACADEDAGAGCGGPEPGAYQFLFLATAAQAPVLRVPMGEVRAWSALESGHGSWDVKNLRSFQSTACDDYWNFAWWLAWRPPS